MEFQIDLSQIAQSEIIKIDNTLLPIGYTKENPELVYFIFYIIIR